MEKITAYFFFIEPASILYKAVQTEGVETGTQISYFYQVLSRTRRRHDYFFKPPKALNFLHLHSQLVSLHVASLENLLLRANLHDIFFYYQLYMLKDSSMTIAWTSPRFCEIPINQYRCNSASHTSLYNIFLYNSNYISHRLEGGQSQK